MIDPMSAENVATKHRVVGQRILAARGDDELGLLPTEFAGDRVYHGVTHRQELDAYQDLADKTGRSLREIVGLFEERRTAELFDGDGKLIYRTGIPGELALRLMQLDEMRPR